MEQVILRKYEGWILNLNLTNDSWFLHHECFSIPENFTIKQRHALGVTFNRNTHRGEGGLYCAKYGTTVSPSLQNKFEALRQLWFLMIQEQYE